MRTTITRPDLRLGGVGSCFIFLVKQIGVLAQYLGV